MTVYVAYYRVSTAKQGRSGLGLDAQRETVRRFLSEDDVVLDEFVEVESGHKDTRTVLQEAIEFAKRNSAVFLVSKLDRFSRRVSFIAGIMDEGLRLAVAEMPNASEFQLHIFAALAQEERRLISERTRAALAQAKVRGVELGKHGKVLARINREAADTFAIGLRPLIAKIGWDVSYSALCDELNKLGVKSVRGGRLYPQTVKNIVCRLERMENPTIHI